MSSTDLKSYLLQLLTTGKGSETLCMNRKLWKQLSKEGNLIAKRVLKMDPASDGYVGKVENFYCYILED